MAEDAANTLSSVYFTLLKASKTNGTCKIKFTDLIRKAAARLYMMLRIVILQLL